MLCHDFKTQLEELNALRAKFDAKRVELTEASDLTEIRAIQRELENKLEAFVFSQVREILGKENVIGPEELEMALGFKLKPEQVPKLKLDFRELQGMRDRKEKLILQIDTDENGNRLDFMNLNQHLLPALQKRGQEKLLYAAEDSDPAKLRNDAWYKDEAFIKATPRAGWRAVSSDVLENSTSKNLADQTKLLAKYLEQHKLVPNGTRLEIAPRPGMKIETLATNQDYRPTPIEILYAVATTFAAHGEPRMLLNKYGWSSIRPSSTGLVFVGYFGANGMDLGVHLGALGSSYLGLLLSRSIPA